MRQAIGRSPWILLLSITAVGCVVVGITTPSFAHPFNIFTILQTASFYAVLGLSQMVVLAIGDMSLAVGGIGGFTTVVMGNLFEAHHWPVAAALFVGLVAGTLCGLVNGVIIARTGLSAFIVTLASGAAFAGVAYGVTSSIPYSVVPSIVNTVSDDRFGIFPYLLLVALAMAGVVFFSFRWLRIGRAILAFGDNQEAARFAGLSKQRAQLVAHSVSGLLAAVAAIMYMGILRTATPATGTDWLIITFAVPIIGGTALNGGEISAPGCLVAGLTLSAINDVLIVLNVNTNAVTLAEGLLILAVVVTGRIGGTSHSKDGGRRFPRLGRRERISLVGLSDGDDMTARAGVS